MASSAMLEALREKIEWLEGLLSIKNLDTTNSIYEKMDTLVESIRSLEKCYGDLSQEFYWKVSALKVDLILLKWIASEFSGRGET